MKGFFAGFVAFFKEIFTEEFWGGGARMKAKVMEKVFWEHVFGWTAMAAWFYWFW